VLKRLAIYLGVLGVLYSLGVATGGSATGFSGHVVSAVGYGISSDEPGAIDSVSFEVAPADDASFKVRLVRGGRWHGCVASSGRFVCRLRPAQPAIAIDRLEVVAVS
jgi:hypothetical protein